MNIVGYRSPFKRKNSPFKVDPLTMAQVGMAVAPGLIGAVGSLFGAGRRRREQKRANEEFKKRKQAFESIQYVNPYENITNPYTNLQNPYAENLYEDLGVNTQSADFLKEQQQQSQANIMNQMRGVAGGSGVAGLAQSMSNIASGQARQASLDIARQERANEMSRIQGEQQRRTGQFGIDKLQASTQFGIDKMQAQGESFRRSQENARTEQMFGLSADRKMAADRARQTARSQFIGGLGQAVGGVAGLYLPGGDRAGLFRQDVASLFPKPALPTNNPPQLYEMDPMQLRDRPISVQDLPVDGTQINIPTNNNYTYNPYG